MTKSALINNAFPLLIPHQRALIYDSNRLDSVLYRNIPFLTFVDGLSESEITEIKKFANKCRAERAEREREIILAQEQEREAEIALQKKEEDELANKITKISADELAVMPHAQQHRFFQEAHHGKGRARLHKAIVRDHAFFGLSEQWICRLNWFGHPA